MKKIVIALFIISIATFGLLKGGLWYFTQQFVDSQITHAKPFAQISYDEIKTSFSGSALVKGIKVYLPLIDDSIYIESVQFIAPDFMTMLTLNSQLENKEIPESLSLIITGASLALTGKLMKMIDNPDIEPTQMEVFSTLACGDVYRIGSQALAKMGYDAFTNDMVLKYQFNARQKTLNYTLRNDIRDFSQINISGELRGVTDLNSFSKKTIQPENITLEISDDSYIERKNRFCANKNKQTIDEYINEHTLQVEEYLLSYGIEAEEGLLNAYKTMLQTHGTITIKADLSDLTGTEEIVTFEPNDFIQFVRLKLFVNNKRINEISIHVDKEKLIESATNEEVELETPDQIKKKQAIIIKKYRPVAIENLVNFNGFRIKLVTTKDKKFKGTLKIDHPRIYKVVTRLRSGNITYHIPIDTIKSAEIFN